MSALEPATYYRICKFSKHIDKNYRQKLLSMGMVPGAQFYVARIAPLGDPIQIDINNFSLSLRAKELNALQLETL